MIKLSKLMLTKLDNGKYLKLEDIYLYGLLANKANNLESHSVWGLSLGWFCACMGISQTRKRKEVIKSRLEKLESMGLIKIDKSQSLNNHQPYYYEVVQPTKEYSLVTSEFFYLKTISAAAKGLGLMLSTLAYKGNNLIDYTDKELAEKCHISINTLKKYKSELTDAGIIKDSILSETYFPIIVTNDPLKDKVAELRLYTGSSKIQKQLDWFESIFLDKTPSAALNKFGLQVLFKIENGHLNNEEKIISKLDEIIV